MDYTNKSIILRAIQSTKEADYPRHIIIDEPGLILALLGHLFLQIRDILSGNYDRLAYTTYEKSALEDFKKRYKKYSSINITSIGFEDYYLVYDLMCHKYKIKNPERYYIREALKSFFIYSIYNKGKVNSIYKRYPEKLKAFFEQYDELYTTNYDQNVEVFSGKKIGYLHGAFNIKKDVYNQDSMRNKMTDSPIKNCNIDETHYYLYSNVLTTYSGYSKMFSIKQSKDANVAIDKMASAYIDNPSIKIEIDNWEKDANELVRKMAECIKLKLQDSEMKFTETYPIQEFINVKGEFDIVGLSPNNDTHIFEILNNNEKLSTITYYYFDLTETDAVKQLLIKHTPVFKDVASLWERYNGVR